MSTQKSLLIFDGDCAFCTKCVLWGTSNLAEFPSAKAFQTINPVDYGLSDADVRKSVWAITDSQVLSGARAVAWILKIQPNSTWRALGNFIDFCPIRPLAALIYRVVAMNRHRMPGATDNCRVVNLDTYK